MAQTLISISVLSFIFFFLFIFQCLSPAIAGEQHEFGRRLSRTKVGSMKEKLSHFRFYFHDILSGQNPTAVIVVRAPNSTSPQGFGFGATAIIDNALTIRPELNSTLVGRAQGLYSTASQTELSFLMAINFVFIEGKYNGSTISIFGRNPIMSKVREMPIIGGTGLFRFARGYVQARTHTLNFENGDATVEYNVYVIHY